jgi:hypothetical protein
MFYGVYLRAIKVLRPFFSSHFKRREEKLGLGLFSRPTNHALAHSLSNFATLHDVIFTTTHHT